MISYSNHNCNTFIPKSRSIVQILEDSIKSLFKKNSPVNKKKDRHLYIPTHPRACVAQAITMKNFSNKTTELFHENKDNSPLFSHCNIVCKNGISRKKRLNRREDVAAISQLLISSYDISTGKIYGNVSYSDISIFLGISVKTVKRIMKDFKRKGWIKVIQKRKFGYDGNFYSIDAEKYLTDHFFKEVFGEEGLIQLNQYRNYWNDKNGKQESKKLLNKVQFKNTISGLKVNINKPFDWKEEAIRPYLEKIQDVSQEAIKIQGSEVIQSFVGALTNSKMMRPHGNVSIADSQRKIYKEDYYDSYKEPATIASVYSPEQTYIPQHASHRDFVSPVIEQSIEQARETARRHIAEMRSKLGMKSSTSPP